jgi:thioesterase domain-containing protein
MSMPQRERAYALYEIAGDAMAAYRPTSSSVAVSLFVARDGGLAGLDADWERFAGKLDVVHLDCDHFQILGPPHVDVVARAIRGEDLAAAG